MARTDEAAIGLVIKVKTGIVLTPFITAANTLVTQCCTELVVDYTAAELLDIETWLAAHFYAQREKQIETEKAESVTRKFATKVDLGFNNTYHGQTAMRLDYHGGLALLNKEVLEGKKRTVGFTWLGTPDPTDIEATT